MALDDQQKGGFKYFCRICKRGFMCGRALGGHMRAHGIESGNYDDDDPASDWEDRDNAPANKRFYALRTNPNRLKSCRSCENCGKEFMSWKSFLEHGKCNSNSESEDGDGNESLPSSDGEEPRECRWSKRKRSLRAKVGGFNFTPPSSVEEDIAATCLVMLSNASVVADQPEESCASASREEERRNSIRFMNPSANNNADKAKGVAKALFECKACKKVFNSHQALGGHRASHKKVKGCFAAKFDLADDDDAVAGEDYYLQSAKPASYYAAEPATGSSRRKSKVHECSICHRIFSSGQALGGHKRCHWITSGLPETSPMNKFQHVRDQIEQINERPSKIAKSDNLDLNMPAPGDELAGIRSAIRNPLSLHVSTEIHLQSWIDVDAERKNVNNNENSTTVQNVDDEADSEVKIAKLSELKDLSNSGGSSPWLQVGIGSTTGGGSAADP